ncbi:chemotaxis protein CheB [Rhodobacterales bacterium HKCCE2091]|nr:chemotaxis protein CheB [Rhodobacterales bacterium HKCCE2091]
MRVILASADGTRRDRLAARIGAIPGVTLTLVASELSEAYHVSEHRPPDLAVIGEALARLPEFEVMLMLFRAVKARVVVVVGSGPGRAPLPVTLRRGDLMVLDEAASDDVFRRAVLDGPAIPPATPARSPAPHRSRPVIASPAARSPEPPAPAAKDGPNTGAYRRIVMIGASTGGVDSLISVLSDFPVDCPPTLIVQHTGAAFSAGLARLLDNRTAARVIEAEEGMTVAPGTVVLAPGDRCHLEARFRGASVECRLRDGPEISGHRPAVDALFRSGARNGKRVAAAILTGMGRDGAEGLLDLRRAGARTFGQDRATSLVYGMPKIAQDLGAVERQLPIDQIGRALLSAARERAAA